MLAESLVIKVYEPPDMSLLFCFVALQNRILWIDEKNLTAHVEAGIVGQDLERLVSSLRLQW